MIRRLVTTVVVLIALFVLADRVSVWYAQNHVATALRQTENLTSTPTVKIHGFPFLTQLLRGHFSDVEVVVHNYTVSSAVPLDRIDVHLHDAQVGFDGIGGNVNRVPVKHVDAVVLVSYAALSNAHRGLTFTYGGGDRVQITGGVTIGGRTVNATASGRMNLSGTDLSVEIDGVQNNQGVAGVDAAARRVFAVTSALPRLPFHFRLTSARARSDGIEIAGTADNVVLSRSGG